MKLRFGQIVKLILVTIIMLLMVGIFLWTKINSFAGNDTIKFGIQEYRKKDENSNQYAYKVDDKVIWKIVKYQNDGSTFSYDDIVYSLKAEKRFGNTGSYTQDYDRYYDFRNSESMKLVMPEENYQSVLWILDHAYIPNSSTAKEDKKELLSKAEILESDITEDEIDLIQQLAIWYYTNQTEENASVYHKEEDGVPTLGTISQSMKNEYVTSKYESLQGQKYKKEAMEKLFNYFVAEAGKQENRDAYEQNTAPIKIEDSNVQAIRYGEECVIGPFSITLREEDLVGKIEAKILDQNGENLEGKYQILNEEKEIVEGKAIQDFAGEKFYIRLQNAEEKIEKIRLELSGKYQERKITYWGKNGDATVEPLVMVREIENPASSAKEVELPKIESSYYIQLVNEDWNDGNIKLKDAKFEIIKPDGTKVEKVTDAEGKIELENAKITEAKEMVYTIKQIEATDRYLTEKNEIQLKIATRAKNGKYYIDSQIIEGPATSELKNNEIYITMKNKQYDLSLRMFVSEVGELTLNREPSVDLSKINQTEEEIRSTTAKYEHTKSPATVGTDDVITYTIRVYNEGNVDAYANEVTFYLPPELELINDLTNYPEETDFNAGYRWRIVPGDIRKIKTNYLAYSSNIIDKEKNEANKIKAFDGKNLDYKEIKIKCKVKDGIVTKEKITTLAQITKEADELGNLGILDRDSISDGNFTLPLDEELAKYKEEKIVQDNRNVLGQEDDDDFEQIVMQDFDLSLRQFITKVNDRDITDRIPTINTEELVARTQSTAVYNHTKSPIDVRREDTITYTIRIYNEADVPGYANEITSYLPEGLEFIKEDVTNQGYEWKLLEDGKTVKTNYLSKEKDETSHLIKAFDGTTLSYKEVKLVCKVSENAKLEGNLTVISEITESQDQDGTIIIDRDSKTKNLKMLETQELEFYRNAEIQSGESYIRGEEDDTDFEKVHIVYYDFEIQSYVSKVNEEVITNRIPQRERKETGEINYTKTEEIVAVENNDVVYYTIRIYNDGLIDGYASKIVSKIDPGTVFDPNQEVNKQYKWTMYKKANAKDLLTIKSKEQENLDTNAILNYENEVYIKTDKKEEANLIYTEYLSKENGEENNLIKHMDETKMDPSGSFKEIQLALTIDESKIGDQRELNNVVELIETRDLNNQLLEEKHTNIDITRTMEENSIKAEEKIKVKEFDLSIKTKLDRIVIDGVKAEKNLIESKLNTQRNKITNIEVSPFRILEQEIKLEYSIAIENQGSIPGYAKEITIQIPKEFEYVTKENEWNVKEETVLGETILSTESLANIQIEPGETIEITIPLKWKNSYHNMGIKQFEIKLDKTQNDKNAKENESNNITMERINVK